MKNDTHSGEAGEPPGEKVPSGDETRGENREPERARGHVPESPSPSCANGVFRKTELWDRPPLVRPEVPGVREKGPDRQVDAIHGRIDILEDRIEESGKKGGS